MGAAGWFHVHSDFSFDGEMAIDEIVELVRSKGYRFLAMCEHVIGMDEGQFSEYIDCCKMACSEDMVVIPGLEVLSEYNMEILAVGIETFIGPGPLRIVIDAIHDAGGLAVLAHPHEWTPDFYLSMTGILADLDGVEVWNHRRDGDARARPGNLKLLEQIKDHNPRVQAFAGMDFHGRFKGRDVVTYVEEDERSASAIVKAIRAGRFSFGRGELKASRSFMTELARWMIGRE